ncbi:MAG: Methyltransferase [Labilithrix sp.]|nr:Methyltransferase [Labilithrix sp.]
MSDGANPEYVTDVTYVRSFERELAPVRLRAAAALNGFDPPPGERFTYGELGAAHGDTLLVLAAANPQADFFAIDLNAEHVASGNRAAREHGLDNAFFVERDFEDLENADLPIEFDYLCAHGVMSWVGPAKRKALLGFASRRLAPGGLLHVSYNAMPGWAAVEPLRQLLVSAGASAAGSSLERARQGLAFAKALEQAGAEYFVDNPAAREMLVTMEKAGLSYIVHEYLNAHWTPMYFAQVAWEMAQHDLGFAGQLPLYLNYRDLVIPPALGRLFQNVTDRPTFESLKDYAVNEFFRRDLYVKGHGTRRPDAADRYLKTTTFTLPRGIPADRSVSFPHARLGLDAPIHGALLAALDGEPRTGAELAARPELEAHGEAEVLAALTSLLVADHVAEARDGAATPPATGRVRVPLAYNREVLDRALVSAAPLVLASPRLGTGVPITVVRAVALRLRAEVPAHRHDAWVREHFVEKGRRLVAGDRVVASAEELLALVRDELADIERSLPRLVGLGVLAPG